MALEPLYALLLACLALDGPTARALLAARLWPDVAEARARGNLRQRLLRLRRLVGAELVNGGDYLALAPGVTHDLDDDGDLLTAITASQAGGFAEWLEVTRQARGARRAHRFEQEAARAEAAGDLTQALQHTQQLLALDPLAEAAHRRLMRLHYLRGDRAAARAAYRRCADLLQNELGTAPAPETEALRRQIETAVPPAPVRVALPVTVLRPPRLIGREAERAAIAAAWAAGQAVLLHGEAGIGKTRLLTDCADAGTAFAAARPGDGAVPFAAAARLLAALSQRAPDAVPPALKPQLAVLLPESPAAGLKAGGLARLAQALRTVLERACAAGLSAVMMDDLHFADEASLELLRALLAAETPPLRWALAQRPAEAAAGPILSELIESRRLVPLALAPLPEAALAELIESLDAPHLESERLAPALARHCGGNPLFVLETVKQMLVDGVADGHAHLPQPATVGALIARRLQRLSPAALALARLAAVAGADFSARLAERILGTAALQLADAWAELEAAHVLRDAAFAHDLVYEAALAAVPAAIARELHGRVADELEAQGAAAERVAHHRLAAGDARRSLPALRAAAASALAKFQRPLAARLLEEAAQLHAQLDERDAAFKALAEAVQLRQSFDSGPAHEAATAQLLALARKPAQRAEALTHRACFLLILGRAADALPLTMEALAAARVDGDDAARARVLNMQGIALRRLGRVDEAIGALTEAVAIARRLEGAHADDLPAFLNNLALAFTEADDQLPAILHFEEAARRQTDTPTRARVLNNLAIALEEIGHAERALDTRRDALALLRGHEGAEFAQLNLLVSLASAARHLQRYADALQWLEQAQSLAAAIRHWRIVNLYQERALLFTELGAWQAAEEALAAVERAGGAAAAESAETLLVRALYQQARNVDASATLERAEALYGANGERRFQRRLRIARIRLLQPSAALALASAEMEREAARGNRASQIPFATLAAQTQLALRRPAAALTLAQRALEAMRTARPLGFSPFEVRFTWYEALAASADASAEEAIGKLAADLRQLAATQVPEAYRNSFLAGVALHRRILAAAARSDGAPKLRLLKR